MDKKLQLQMIESFYDEAKVEYSESVLMNLIDANITAKKQLHDMLCTHDGWDADLDRLQFTVTYKIEPNYSEAGYWFRDILVRIYNILSWEYRKMERDNPDNKYIDYVVNYYNQLNRMAYTINSTITGMDIASTVNHLFNSNFSARKKTSKCLTFIVDNLIKIFGIDEDEDLKHINSKLAKVTDLLRNDKIISKTVCLSLNLYDFLTMSDGYGWSSCHYPHNCYCAGCQSYALDDCTVICYVENDGKKEYRNLFFVNPDCALFSSRKYGYYDTEFIDALNKAVLNVFGYNSFIQKDRWYIGGYFSTADNSQHFPDYDHDYPMQLYVNGNISSMDVSDCIIGHESFCTQCGNVLYESSDMYCDDCNHYVYCYKCGERITDGNYILYDDRYYCLACCTYCDECGEYVPTEVITRVHGSDICPVCLEDNYFVCDSCGQHELIDEMTELYEGEFVCEYCRDDSCVYDNNLEYYIYACNAEEVETEAGIEYHYRY